MTIDNIQHEFVEKIYTQKTINQYACIYRLAGAIKDW